MLVTKIIKYWLPPIIWGALIFSVSSGSVPKVSTVYWEDFAAHKAGHIIEYSVLGILIWRAFLQEKFKKKSVFIYCVLISFLYGLSDEFHQRFTPHRDSRFRDVIIDTIGASVGVLIIWKLLPKAPKKLLILAEKLDLL